MMERDSLRDDGQRTAREDLDALVVLHERDGIADAVVGFHAQQALRRRSKQRSCSRVASSGARTTCAF
jgi:hypothetical protein